MIFTVDTKQVEDMRVLFEQSKKQSNEQGKNFEQSKKQFIKEMNEFISGAIEKWFDCHKHPRHVRLNSIPIVENVRQYDVLNLMREYFASINIDASTCILVKSIDLMARLEHYPDDLPSSMIIQLLKDFLQSIIGKDFDDISQTDYYKNAYADEKRLISEREYDRLIHFMMYEDVPYEIRIAEEKARTVRDLLTSNVDRFIVKLVNFADGSNDDKRENLIALKIMLTRIQTAIREACKPEVDILNYQKSIDTALEMLDTIVKKILANLAEEKYELPIISDHDLSEYDNARPSRNTWYQSYVAQARELLHPVEKELLYELTPSLVKLNIKAMYTKEIELHFDRAMQLLEALP